MMTVRSKESSCRVCGGIVRFIGAPGAHRSAATSYGTCLYECESCRRRYSNARDPEQRTMFESEPAANVPPEIVPGLHEVLDSAINKSNRRNKREKFCAETSEDAVTWTVFRWLQQTGHATLVPELCGSNPPKGAPSLLLWGASAGGEEASDVRERYLLVSDPWRGTTCLWQSK